VYFLSFRHNIREGLIFAMAFKYYEERVKSPDAGSAGASKKRPDPGIIVLLREAV